MAAERYRTSGRMLEFDDRFCVLKRRSALYFSTKTAAVSCYTSFQHSDTPVSIGY